MAKRIPHSSKVPEGRLMTAPYNFVPLAAAFMAAEKPPDADRFDDQLLSGEICYKATALTPLYTRAALSPGRAGTTERARADFYHQGDPQTPCLPGSSIRGMTRATVTLLACGKFPKAKERRLYFRSFGGGVMAELYGQKMVENCGQVQGPTGRKQGYRTRTQAGFLLRDEQGIWKIFPCLELRASRRMLPPDLYETVREGDRILVPNRRYQYREVWVKASSWESDWRLHKVVSGQGMYTWRRDVEAVDVSKQDENAGWRRGWLVITGNMQNKKAEFVFVPLSEAKAIHVPDPVMMDAQADDQISNWQERAFPPNGQFQPSSGVHLEGVGDCQPVWFLKDEKGEVTGLGRAQNFRLRYERNTQAFVPESLRAQKVPELDLPERLFGRVLQGTQGESAQIRGRVRFEDAICQASDPWLPPIVAGLQERVQDRGLRVPRILASPKPTAFQLYLNQPNTEEKALIHYSKQEGEVRGTKLYWHRNQPTPTGQIEPLPESELFKQTLVTGSQDTLIRPVRPGSSFDGIIRFDNLEPEELGALLASLDLPKELAHRFGMGKPLGLGSLRVRLETVRLVDRRARYRAWTDGVIGGEETERKLKDAREKFRLRLVSHHRSTPGGTAVGDDTPLWEMPQAKVLSMMLSWKEAPPPERTRYVALAGPDALLWRRRNVLPAPHDVLGRPDPLRSAGTPMADSKLVTVEKVQVGKNTAAVITSWSGSSSPTVTAVPGDPLTMSRLMGLQTLQLQRPHNDVWIGLHTTSGAEIEVRRVKASLLPKQGDWIKANVRLMNGGWTADFVGRIASPDPDESPHDSRAEAEVINAAPGSLVARLVGGKKEWPLRGALPPSVSVETGSLIRVRIVRTDGSYLTFALERE